MMIQRKGPISHGGSSLLSREKTTCPRKLWEGSREVGQNEMVQRVGGILQGCQQVMRELLEASEQGRDKLYS